MRKNRRWREGGRVEGGIIIVSAASWLLFFANRGVGEGGENNIMREIQPLTWAKYAPNHFDRLYNGGQTRPSIEHRNWECQG